MSLAQNLTKISSLLPASVKLVAVSKTQLVSTIQEAYQLGQRRFGENKVQELVSKHPLLPTDIEWHFIGHLQSNKVKLIIPFVSMIHSIDSLKLLIQVNQEAAKAGRVIDCLLEIHIASEESKFGLDFSDAKSLVESDTYRSMKNIILRGVMGMATFTDDITIVRNEFRTLHSCFESIKKDHFPTDERFSEISMGMSDDFNVAVEEGSTIVRIGTALFGSRIYQ